MTANPAIATQNTQVPLVRVAVHGVPRSGTTWVGEILNSSPNVIYKYQPLFAYALKGFLTPNSTPAEIDAFFSRLVTTQDEFMDQVAAREAGKLPSFTKSTPTHVVYKEVRYHGILTNLLQRAPDVRLIAVIRNPLATLNSWLRAPREFRQDLGWSVAAEWRAAPSKNLDRPEEYNGYERWKEATRLFLRLEAQFPDRVHLLRYSALVNNTSVEVERLFTFCGLSVTEQTLAFLTASTTQMVGDAYAVYRSQQTDDRWRTELDPEIVAAVCDDLKTDQLSIFLE